MSQLLSTTNTAFLPGAVIPGKEFVQFNLEYLLIIKPLHTAEIHRSTKSRTASQA